MNDYDKIRFSKHFMTKLDLINQPCEEITESAAVLKIQNNSEKTFLFYETDKGFFLECF